MRQDCNIGEAVSTGFALGQKGLNGVLEVWAQRKYLSENQKGHLKCALPTPEIIQRSTLIAMDTLTDGRMLKFIKEYPHTRITSADLEVGDIVMCTSMGSVYMVTK